MAKKGGKGLLVSVICTTMNEGLHIRSLLESLVIQEPPLEVVIVDAESTDSTQAIVKEFADKYDFVHLYIKPGSRGVGMNHAVEMSTGDVLAFIGGDCKADSNWIRNIRHYYTQGAEILVGKTNMEGYKAFKDLERVELFHKGFDVSYAGCATAYRSDIFKEIGGFDPWFITAEDIDMNYRAVDKGYGITNVEMCEDAPLIYHGARETMKAFFKQAFWNGYGRKQLTMKHGKLWANYSFKQMIFQKISFWKLSRLAMATMGYLFCKLTAKAPKHVIEARAEAAKNEEAPT